MTSRHEAGQSNGVIGCPFEEIDIAAHHREIAVNCTGIVNGLHAAFEYLRATPGATVVNLASASAIYGQPELAVYSATKFFIRAVTEALDLEWRRHGIRVIDMWPLFVRTAMTDDIDTGTTRSLGIHLRAEDVAAAIIAAVEPGRRQQLLRQVHFPVGTSTRAFAIASRFSPAWLTRALNKYLSHS